jgi:hypothetical protein
MALSGVSIGLSKHYIPFALSFFVMYIWNGMLEILLAIVSVRLFSKHTGMMMNVSHFFYGLSSTIAPIAAIMDWKVFGGILGWRRMYMIILSLCLIPMILSFFALFQKKVRRRIVEVHGKIMFEILYRSTWWLYFRLVS